MGNIIHASGKSVIKIDPATGDELVIRLCMKERKNQARRQSPDY